MEKIEGREMSRDLLNYIPFFIRKRLEGQYGLQQIISNTAFLFADKSIRLGIGLIVSVWVARYLGPEQFGIYNYALAVVALFSSVVGLGLDNIVIRNIVRDPSSKYETLGTAFALKLFSGTIMVIITVGAIFLFRPNDNLTHWLVGIIAAGMIFQACDTVDLWFQSQVRSKYSIYAQTPAFLILTIIKIVLILAKAPLIAFAWAGLAEIILGSAGLLIAYRFDGQFLNAWRIRLNTVRGLLSDSWPLILSGLVIMIYMRIDQVMLGEISGNEEVGIYSAAVRLAEIWYFIPMIVVSSVYPSIVAAREMNEELFYNRLQKLYNLMAFLAYAVALPVSFFSKWIVKILFGAAYSKAAAMLAILIWAGLFVNLGVARSSFLTTMNWTRVHFVTVFGGCLINIALNFVLIPRYGGIGAVIASCFAYWFAAHGACFFYKPLHKTGYMLTKAIFYPRIW